jgi:hypothetical protein
MSMLLAPTALTCAVIVAWIFVLTRTIELTLKLVSRYRHGRQQARHAARTTVPLEYRAIIRWIIHNLR